MTALFLLHIKQTFSLYNCGYYNISFKPVLSEVLSHALTRIIPKNKARLYRIYFNPLVLRTQHLYTYAAALISSHVWNFFFFLRKYLPPVSHYSGCCTFMRRHLNKYIVGGGENGAVENSRWSVELVEVNVKTVQQHIKLKVIFCNRGKTAVHL